jgi:CRISPR-associated protein Cmr4
MVGLTMVSDERLKKGENRADRLSAEKVLARVREAFHGHCVQIGGDATTGRGQVLVSFRGGKA